MRSLSFTVLAFLSVVFGCKPATSNMRNDSVAKLESKIEDLTRVETTPEELPKTLALHSAVRRGEYLVMKYSNEDEGCFNIVDSQKRELLAEDKVVCEQSTLGHAYFALTDLQHEIGDNESVRLIRVADDKDAAEITEPADLVKGAPFELLSATIADSSLNLRLLNFSNECKRVDVASQSVANPIPDLCMEDVGLAGESFLQQDLPRPIVMDEKLKLCLKSDDDECSDEVLVEQPSLQDLGSCSREFYRAYTGENLLKFEYQNSLYEVGLKSEYWIRGSGTKIETYVHTDLVKFLVDNEINREQEKKAPEYFKHYDGRRESEAIPLTEMEALIELQPAYKDIRCSLIPVKSHTLPSKNDESEKRVVSFDPALPMLYPGLAHREILNRELGSKKTFSATATYDYNFCIYRAQAANTCEDRVGKATVQVDMEEIDPENGADVAYRATFGAYYLDHYANWRPSTTNPEPTSYAGRAMSADALASHLGLFPAIELHVDSERRKVVNMVVRSVHSRGSIPPQTLEFGPKE